MPRLPGIVLGQVEMIGPDRVNGPVERGRPYAHDPHDITLPRPRPSDARETEALARTPGQICTPGRVDDGSNPPRGNGPIAVLRRNDDHIASDHRDNARHHAATDDLQAHLMLSPQPIQQS